MNRIVIALLAGLFMGITPAPINAWYFAWFALVPLWILIVLPERQNFKSIILLALAWGCGYHGLALFWITGIHPMTWMGIPWFASLLIAIFCWLFITFWGAALVVIWCVGMSGFTFLRLKQKSHFVNASLRLLIGVALWCVLEATWSQGSLWWSSLSYTQSPANLAILQLSQLSGPSTIVASIVVINGVIAEILLYGKYWQSFDRKIVFWLFLPLTFYLILYLIGFNLYNRPLNDIAKNAIKVGIIQGNIPNEIKLYPAGWLKAIEGYTSGYEHLAESGVQLIITPETALPFLWTDIVTNSSLYPVILKQKRVALIGAFGKQSESFTNSIFTVSSDGSTFSRYDKVKLVPLGEYIPFKEFFGQFINRLSPLDVQLAAGNSHQIFDTPFGRAIIGICYDSAFAEHFRSQTAAGGEFIITAANNAHYSQAMPAQHHAQDIMRAIESDRWLARATNTGYSTIINPKGETQWISGINIYQLHQGVLYKRATKTLYIKWGDWLTLVLLILATAACFWVAISKESGSI